MIFDAYRIRQLERQVLVQREQITRLRDMVETALIWMAQSANSPLRADDVAKLLKMVKP